MFCSAFFGERVGVGHHCNIYCTGVFAFITGFVWVIGTQVQINGDMGSFLFFWGPGALGCVYGLPNWRWLMNSCMPGAHNSCWVGISANARLCKLSLATFPVVPRQHWGLLYASRDLHWLLTSHIPGAHISCWVGISANSLLGTFSLATVPGVTLWSPFHSISGS